MKFAHYCNFFEQLKNKIMKNLPGGLYFRFHRKSKKKNFFLKRKRSKPENYLNKYFLDEINFVERIITVPEYTTQTNGVKI